ncbi:hypothetical protein K502DRAFT_194590 [Neoconidiobolus thromboides FSU 785]|nr:hypothetical protein K502DRAFT_194590 [Neoconidiobolus thromboides FSU 785]
MHEPNQFRFRLLDSHVNMLEALYNNNPRPSLKTRKELASRMGIEQRKIQIWFQNRRAKDNREKRLISNELAYVNNKATNPLDSPDISTTNSEEESMDDNIIIIQSDDPNVKRVFSHYWASTMNSCRIFKF